MAHQDIVAKRMRIKKAPAFLLFVVCLAGFNFAQAFSPSDPPGFVARKGTVIYLDGKPFAAIGVNKYDLFSQFVLGDSGRWGETPIADAREQLQEINNLGIGVIRVNFSPFWQAWWLEAFWDDDKDVQLKKRQRFFTRLDMMLDVLDELDIKIVATLVWNIANLGDLGHHSLREGMTNWNSLGFRRVKEYIGQVVSRYKDRSAIAVWEIGNEWNLRADLQKPGGVLKMVGLRQVVPPMVRDSRNNFNSEELAKSVQKLAEFIKSIDSHHLVSAGHSAPRPAAWNLLQANLSGRQPRWGLDSWAEQRKYFALVNPDPVDLISIHYYRQAMLNFGGEPGNVKNVAVFKRIAESMGRPLLIGEIGLYKEIGSDYRSADALDHLKNTLQLLIERRVSLSFYWTYADSRTRPEARSGRYLLRQGQTQEALNRISAANREIQSAAWRVMDAPPEQVLP